MNESLAIVVASCDKYSDLWEALFGEFFRYWPDCPYPIYLVANHLTYHDARVKTLLAGDDLDWSTTMAKSLQGLGHSHVLFWIDDAFLSHSVNSFEVEKLFNFVVDQQVNFLRLRPNPKPRNWLNSDIGILDAKAAYRVSLFATIWRIDTFNSILLPGESAWQFEVNGTERSREMANFYSTKKDVFNYLHGVERGIWISPTVNVLQKKGYSINKKYRRVMTGKQNLNLKFRLFKSWILHLIPENQRENVLMFCKWSYRILGIRKG